MRLASDASVDLVSELRARRCPAPVVFMDANPSARETAAALSRGIADVLRRPFDPSVLTSSLAALRSTVENARKSAPEVQAPGDDALRERLARLTPREREIAQLVGDGRSSKEIASALGLSKRTVDNHRARVLAKLELDNSAQIARALSRLGGAG